MELNAQLTAYPLCRHQESKWNITFFVTLLLQVSHTLQPLRRPSDARVFPDAWLEFSSCFEVTASPMQIKPLLLKSPLFRSGVNAERQAAETPAVVREALEQQARDRL